MNFTMPFKRATGTRALIIGALAVGVLSIQVGRGTMAYFTTQVSSGANLFSAGNLHFNIGDNNESPSAAPVSASIALSNIKPGDSVYAPIMVSNVGSLDGQYGIKYTTTGGTNDLTSHLTIKIVAKGSGTAAAANCVSGSFTTAAIWKEQISPTAATLLAAQTFVDSTWTTPPSVDGAYSAAEATASHFLPLDHAGGTLPSDLLCVSVAFPDNGAPSGLTTQDNAFNGATNGSWSTTVAFTFDGQQRNHPVEFDQPTGPSPASF